MKFFLPLLLFSLYLQSSTNIVEYIEKNKNSLSVINLRNKTINLKKGLNSINNKFTTIDVVKSFKNEKDIQAIVYDDISKKYAIYPFINDKQYLKLKAIEKGVKFYIYITKDMKISFRRPSISKVCQKKFLDKKYSFIYDSGIDKVATINKNKSIGINSRYYSNHFRETYDDTTVFLIYPKINKTSKMKYKYGSAIPTMQVFYSKEYENKKFYMYDFLRDSCYEGIFPSMNFPPLKELRKID